MTRSVYSTGSPWANTPEKNVYLEYLDFWKGPFLSPSSSDKTYIVQPKYNKRPDLLSFDLYGTTSYWWIFSLRNPDIIKDPMYDLKPGITIYLPSKDSLPQGER